jgi:hypothetical protein
LRYAVGGTLRANEYFYIPEGGIDSTPAGRERVFAWVQTNYQHLSTHMPPPHLPDLPFFADGCEPRILDAARTFFSQPEHQVDGTLSNLRKVGDCVGDCAGLQGREFKSINAYLYGRPQPR